MRHAIDETTRRRRTQQEYNERNGITPQSIIKPVDMSLVAIAEADYVTVPLESDDEIERMTKEQRDHLLGELEERMREAARKFEFEKAAQIRDRLKALRASAVEGIGAVAS
jgi:excinuclease ABC subunit B